MSKLWLTACFSAFLSTSSLMAADVKEPATIEIKLSTHGNNIAFDKNAIEVPLGKKVSVRFVNQASKESEILHNVAILKPGTFDEVIKELQKNGYDIEKMRKHPSIITMSKALAPAQEETLTFTPKEPGEYPYICLMAGHADMLGMKGIFKVSK